MLVSFLATHFPYLEVFSIIFFIFDVTYHRFLGRREVNSGGFLKRATAEEIASLDKRVMSYIQYDPRCQNPCYASDVDMHYVESSDHLPVPLCLTSEPRYSIRGKGLVTQACRVHHIS